ncbi:MAG: hypothetical protein KDD10_15145 [Phaeodactylibacter sp.]|nr:hypothetical protein [Phaeodactylibacter sp.]
MRTTTVLFSSLLWAALAAAQSTDIPIITADDLMDAFHEEAANRIEEALREDEEAADSVAWVPDLDEWEESFRTSEWDAVVSDRPEGRRIGCICMDGAPQEEKGRGACAGRGGVRFWLYQNGDSIILDPTRRHYGHPAPFTEEEKGRLAAYNEGERVAYGAGRRLGDDFANIVMVMMVCITIGYVARLYFTHGAD